MTRPSQRACTPCATGEHEFCEGGEDIVIVGEVVPAVPLRCACTHGPPARDEAARVTPGPEYEAPRTPAADR